MTNRILRCVLGIALGASALAAVTAAPTQAVEVGDPIEIGGTQGLKHGIAHNPERNEYLAAYSTSQQISVVRLDANGATLSGPTVIAGDLGLFRFDTDVSYNAATNQYLVSYAQQINPTDGQASLYSYGQLVSDTGALVGPRALLHGQLGTNATCRSAWPQHEANPATGGYTVMYTKWYGTTTDLGNICDGLAPSKSRTVVASLGGDLSLGKSVDIAGGDPGVKDNHVSVNPKTGDVLVIQRTTGPSGQATIFSPTLDQTASFSFVREDRANDNAIIDPVAASDPVTGNWLIVWGVDGVTMVVDSAGKEVVAPANRIGARLIEVAAAADGSFWGVNRLGSLVHLGAGGELLSVSTAGRDGGHPGLAIGSSDVGVRGLAFVPTGSFSIPTIIPFTDAPAVLPLVPARVLETREGTASGTIDGLLNGQGIRSAGSVLTLPIAGRGGVPANATAAMLNIAAVGSSLRGFVTAYPCDADRPTSSNLNFDAGGAASAAAFVTLSAVGTVCLFTSASVDLIVDANGYAPSRASITPLVPKRLLETRAGTPDGTVDGVSQATGRVAAGGEVQVKVTDRAGVAADAAAVVVNVTSINPSQRIFVTVYACGSTRPTAANLNAAAGQNVNNLVLAKVGDGGKVCIYSSGATDLVMDVSAFVPSGGSLNAVLPARLVETRVGTPDGTIDSNFEGGGVLPVGVLNVDVAKRGPVPETAGGVMLNVAAIAPATGGFMTLYPCDADRPTAANVNFAAGSVVSNAVFVKLSTSGQVCLYTSSATHVAVDVVGYVAA